MQECKYISEFSEVEEDGESVPVYADGYYLGLGKRAEYHDGMFFERTYAVVADKKTGEIGYMPIEGVILTGDGFRV